MQNVSARSIIASSFVLLALCAAAPAQQPASPSPLISTADEIAEDFTHVPCGNKERLSGAQTLLEKMKAPSSSISVEKLPGVDNVVVAQAGASRETIVIGAHYDLADLGCGAVDNWTGVVAVAHLYRTINTLMKHKTVLFVAFGNEERGLIGSKAMLNALPKDRLSDFCAMINIDSFGLATPFALKGSSSPKLMTLADEVSKTMNIPFTTIRISGADSDSSSFIAKGIPAVTLSGLMGDWRSILHTTADQASKVNPTSVYIGYRLALSMWDRIDRAPCDSFR
jgi:Iap family predicted aminopeptidase